MVKLRLNETRKASSAAGFGLIEVLVGVALISLMAASTVLYSGLVKNTFRPYAQDRFGCSAQVASVMSRIRSFAGSLRVVPYPQAIGGAISPFPSAVYTGGGATGNAIVNNGLLTGAVVWPEAAMPAIEQFNAGGAIPYAANGLLIDQGPMRLLNSIYNDQAASCGTYFTPPYGAAWTNFITIGNQTLAQMQVQKQSNNLVNLNTPVTQLMIMAYNLSTGALVPCATALPGGKPLWLYPSGAGAPAPTATESGFIVNAGGTSLFGIDPAYNYQNIYGFQVSVQTKFYELDPSTPGLPNATANSCSLTQRFSYDPIMNVPAGAAAAPTIQLTLDGDQDLANLNLGTATVKVNYPISQGQVVACRDRSTYLVQGPNAIIACYVNAPATTGPGYQRIALGGTVTSPLTFPPPRNFLGVQAVTEDDVVVTADAAWGAGAATPRHTLALPTAWPVATTTWRPATEAADDENAWVPCESLTLCNGVAPVTTATTTAGASPAMTAQVLNTYGAPGAYLPTGCIARVEVALMDSAGNLYNANAGGAYYPTPPTGVPNHPAMPGADNILQPTCGGTICNSGAAGTSSWNSYWLSNGTCCTSPANLTPGPCTQSAIPIYPAAVQTGPNATGPVYNLSNPSPAYH